MPHDAFAFGSFRLVPAERTLFDGAKPLRIGGRALAILTALVERAGREVPKEDLIARAWPNTTVDEASLRVHIAALRKSLGDDRSGNRFIANVPGRGYIFVAPASRVHAEPAVEPPRAAADGNDIPGSLSRVIGREDVIARLAGQLTRRRLVTIVGPGGVGKTTVAAGVANAARGSFADGVWFVALASLSGADLVPGALASVLGIASREGDPIVALTSWLRDKQALIVLDNCEHVVDAVAALVEAITAAAPRVTVLATSRESLRAGGEWRYRLAPLALPPAAATLAADDALRFPAIQLFNERAVATAGDAVIKDGDVAAIVEICRRLDGVPLALELVAPHVGLLGLRELANRLNDRFVLTLRGRRTALPRHQTLRATFDWSYELLPRAEQVILRRLGIFRGDFSLEAAGAVVSDEEIAVAEAVNGVANLVDKSLVSVDISGDVTHYCLLETTRTYALERLRTAGEAEPTARSHARYFLALFADAETGTDVWLDEVRHLIDNLRAALDWAFSPSGDVAIGIKLTARLTPYWLRMSLMTDCARYCERALTAFGSAANQDPRIEMTLHAALGASMTYTTGPVAGTVAAWSRTLRLAEQLDDTEHRLQALRGLWSFRMNVGAYPAALTLAHEFRDLAERRADPNTVRAGNRMAALILHYLGQQAEARELIERNIGDAEAASLVAPAARFMLSPDVAARALLARILWLQGSPEQATRMAESAVTQAKAANHTISLCHALAQAACPVSICTGDLLAADRSVTLLAELAARNSLSGWIARAECYHGELLIRQGRLAEGCALLRSAVPRMGAAGSVAESPAFLAALAHGRGSLGQVERGLATINDAIERSDNTGERWCAAELLRVKGELLLSQARLDESAAEDNFRRSLEIARQQGALSWELRTATDLARLLRDSRRLREAHEMLAQVVRRFSEGHTTVDARAANDLLAQLAAAEDAARGIQRTP